jgi:histidine triad (HIT) family protein
MMSTLFTKIINQTIPSYCIFEDTLTYAFLDINPITVGHLLVVPKTEVDNFEDLTEPYSKALWDTAKKLSSVLKQAYNCKKVALLIEGLEVPHAHIHLIPINESTDLYQNRKKMENAEMIKIQKQVVKFL